jgi:PAS domain S-box-containing protein
VIYRSWGEAIGMKNDTAPPPPSAPDPLSSHNAAAIFERSAEGNEEVLRASEAELRLILQSIAGMICVFSPRGELISSNQQLLDYFKQPLEEVGRWATNGTTHPDDLKQAVESFAASLTSGEPYDFECRFRRFDGAFRWFQIRGHPIRGANGEILRWYGLLTDIDDRKRAEETLRASEIDLRLTLNSIPGMVCTFTADGRFEGGNQQFYDYLVGDQETEAWATKGPVHPDDRDHSVAVFRNAMVTGESYQFEARAVCFDGVYRWFQVLGRPHRDDDGRLVRWYSLLINVDDRKRAEQALEASERNLRLTIDTIPALAWSARPDGTADFLNQHYLDYVGQTSEQVPDWRMSDVVHADDFPKLREDWARFRSEGVGGETEARIRRHDGEYRWFLFRAAPLRDQSGDIVKWYGVNTDIEDRKQAEAALKLSETFLAEGQRISATGSFSWRLDNDELTFSDELCRIFEFETGEAVTFDRILARVHADDHAFLAANMADVRSGIDKPEYGIRLRMADGRTKYVRVFGRIFSHLNGRLECLGAVQDVTVRKRAEDVLAQVRSELAHVTRVLSFGALTASIAHEINQPLSGIITNADTCRRMLVADPPNIAGALETANRTIRDGNRAAEIVLRLRRLYSKDTARADNVDLHDAVAEVVALLASDLQRKRVIVRTEFLDDLPVITGDRVQLQQVIVNMLTNAADAMAGVQDRERAVTVRTARTGPDEVVLSVHDVGVGIGAKEAEDIFQPFFTTKSSGMGIGLSVSRSIVESHGGRLWAAENPGGGAIFSFSIPAGGEVVTAP